MTKPKNLHAAALARLARGVPKTMTPAAVDARRRNIAEHNARRKKQAKEGAK